MRTLISNVRATIRSWGRDIFSRMLCCVVWLAFLLVAAWRLNLFSSIFIALLTAAVVYLLNVLRNLHLEAQLQRAIQSFNEAQVSVSIIPEGGRKRVRCDFHVLVRNTTSVPIMVRDVRLRFAEVPPAKNPVRLKYYKPTYHVINRDPDERDGIFMPIGAELPFLKVGESYSLSAEPGEFHEIPPQCGALYGLPAFTIRSVSENPLQEVLMIVDYPTILGSRKVLCVRATPHALAFIQRMLRDALTRLEKAEAEAKEWPEGIHGRTLGRTIESMQQE